MDEEIKNREVVLCYSQKPEEIVEYYVQKNDFPVKAKRQKKHAKKGALIFAIVMAVIILGVVATMLIVERKDHGETILEENDESGKAASIVEISTEEQPKLSVFKPQEVQQIVLISCEGKAKLLAEDIYESVSEATVFVMSEEDDGVALGTGIILSEDGYILTNAHIISGSKEVWVSLEDNTSYNCELVGYSFDEDIAVLHCMDAKNLPYAELGDSDECKVGQTVYAIGNPLGADLRGTFTSGILSYESRSMTVNEKNMVLMQTDAAINSGNSGGPLINAYGQVVGIITMKIGNNHEATDQVATIENLGFAIPSSHFIRIVNDILETGEYHGTATLGISVAEVGRGEDKVLEVVVVDEAYGGYEAGILEGDIILKADGVEVSTAKELLELRNMHAVGDSMTLTVLRNGEEITFSVKLYSNIK